jgi:hypothetical protein
MSVTKLHLFICSHLTPKEAKYLAFSGISRGRAATATRSRSLLMKSRNLLEAEVKRISDTVKNLRKIVLRLHL